MRPPILQVKQAMAKYYTYQVNVQSMTTVDSYKVSQCQDGHWECSCKAWIFGRKFMHNGTRYKQDELDRYGIIPNGKCKHIMFAEEHRHDIRAAVTSGADSFSVSNAEFKVEFFNGRAQAFFADLEAAPGERSRGRRKAV